MVKRLAPVLLLAVVAGCPNDFGKSMGKGRPSGLIAPADLSATPNGGSEVLLAWSDRATSESGYRVEISGSGFTSGMPDFDFLPADATNFRYETSPNTTLSFRVFAITASFESEPSNVATLTMPNVPPRPGHVTASTLSTVAIDVAWSDVASETAYMVEMSEDGGRTWSIRASTAANVPRSSVAPLIPDREYGFRVIAVNDAGASTPSYPDFALTMSAGVVCGAYATTGNVGAHPSLAFRPGGSPCISHYDVERGDLLFTAPQGLLFHTVTIDAGPSGMETVGADGTALVIDAAGKAHVVAHDLTNDTLRYATNASGSWVASTIDAGPGTAGARPRLLYHGGTGTLHAYYHTLRPTRAFQVQHATKTSAQPWDLGGLIAVGANASARHGVFLDGDGGEHVALVTGSGQIYYNGPLGGAGGFLPLTGVGGAAQVDDVAIVVDSSRRIHVLYHDRGEGSLMHATSTGGSWTNERVDHVPGHDLGSYCSVAIDPSSDRLHVAYQDGSRRDLRYARKDPGGPWVRRLLDAPGDLAGGLSVALDGGGYCWIAYRDDTNGDLKLVTGVP